MSAPTPVWPAPSVVDVPPLEAPRGDPALSQDVLYVAVAPSGAAVAEKAAALAEEEG